MARHIFAVCVAWLMAMRRKPVPAFPELVDGEAWRVRPWVESDGFCPHTDKVAHELVVPPQYTQDARDVRFHELLHVRFSPLTFENYKHLGISNASLQSAEDARINTIGSKIRAFDPGSFVPQQDGLSMSTRFSPRDMAQLVMASVGYSGHKARYTEWKRALTVIATTRATVAVPAWVRDNAKRLLDAAAKAYLRGANIERRYNVHDFDRCTIPIARWLDTFDAGQPRPPTKGNPDPDGEYDDAVESDGSDGSDAEWGTMEIENPPLSVVHPTARRRTTPTLCGNRPQYWNRYPTGEVFGRPRPRGVPDAVLIDQSASMHWDVEQLHELVRRMPVGIIAGYSGSDGVGVLRILAKDGRMVSPEMVHSPYGGNEVDGPALRWLAAQRGRKVWVSDQGVCASGSSSVETLMADCKRTIRQAGIKVCLSTDPVAIMAALNGGETD